MLCILQTVYGDNQAVINWDGGNKQSIEVKRGLRQGCSSRGFDLSYMEDGAYHKHILPALLYADDIVTVGGSVSDLQAILDVCLKEGTSLRLREAIPGDLGWSSSEARKAMAKLTYERRLAALPEGRWAQEAFKYVHPRCLNTQVGGTHKKAYRTITSRSV